MLHSSLCSWYWTQQQHQLQGTVVIREDSYVITRDKRGERERGQKTKKEGPEEGADVDSPYRHHKTKLAGSIPGTHKERAKCGCSAS